VTQRLLAGELADELVGLVVAGLGAGVELDGAGEGEGDGADGAGVELELVDEDDGGVEDGGEPPCAPRDPLEHAVNASPTSASAGSK
jgi:hypothetical protein